MCKISRLKLKNPWNIPEKALNFPWRNPEILLKFAWNTKICPFCHFLGAFCPRCAEKFYTVCGFYPEIFSLLRFYREILHSCKRNFTQFAFVIYAASLNFALVRRARQVLPWNLLLFQREKNQLVPAPLLWYPSSIKTCTRRQNAAGWLGFSADFTEKNVHVSREKSPLSPRKMSTFSEKSYTLLIYIK